MTSFPTQVFVTGTDTDVGKTIVSALLCLRLGASYWKPVQAGFPTDSQRMAGWLGADRVLKEAYILERPLSPNQAAEKEGLTIDPTQFQRPPLQQPLVVEGAGGLLVPLQKDFFMIDLIKKLDLPVVLAARSGLGTLNHTLLSIGALRNRHIPIAGVVLNGEPHPDNARDIARFGKVPILGQVPTLPKISAQVLQEGAFRFFEF